MHQALVAGRDRAPSLVVLGAPRSGTTALATWLTDIGVGVGVKDSFYLMDEDAGLRGPTHLSSHGIEGYLDLFRGAPAPTVEVSAGYLYQRCALEFFRGWETPPKFVVIARDPVKRLRSVYRYFMGNLGILPRGQSFPEYVTALERGSVDVDDWTVADALRQGQYVEYLDRWVSVYGHDAVEVVNFDDLEARPAQVVEYLVKSAGCVPTQDLSSYQYSSRNQSYSPRSAPVTAVTDLGRRLIPSGRARAWGGEQLRRWRVSKDERTAPAAVDPAESDVMQRLSAYYAAPNQQLADRYGVHTNTWT